MTVVEYLDRILPGMDGEVAKQFQRILEKQGFDFLLGAKVTGVETGKDGRDGHRRAGQAAARPRRSRPTSCSSPSAAGPTRTGSASRRPASRSTSAAASSIDDHFQTNVPGIYAIGDVIARADARPQGRGRGHRASPRSSPARPAT